MKGILIDKAEIEKLQKEYKELSDNNSNINKKTNTNTIIIEDLVTENCE